MKEEDWSDDEEGDGTIGAKEASFLSDMLGTSVPPEMLAALGNESFEDVTYDGDDEDLMKDPSVQIDMRVSPSSDFISLHYIEYPLLGSHRCVLARVCEQQHEQLLSPRRPAQA